MTTQRVTSALGLVAALTLAWLGCCWAAPASALPFIVLQLASFAVALAPHIAGAEDREDAVKVAGYGAGILVVLGLLGFALALVPILSWVTALVGAAAAVLLARLRAPVPLPVSVTTSPSASRNSSPRTIITVGDDGFDVGSRVGRYTLQDRLAVGGMGEVWRASHDTLIRPAVLKIIKRGNDRSNDAELMERFRREAMVTANLTSPHTVQLYDFGIESDTLYIAMELLEAMSISAIVTRFGPMEAERVAFLLRQACHSLIEAHDCGIVHRDLKPDNLLVTRAGRDTDFLKVIDFGLVKDLGKKRAMSGRKPGVELTAMGARPGTPGYMAPEQIGGIGVDQRSDIYALACVAYYALTGSPVFEGTQEAQLMFAHMQVEPEAPSVRLGRPVHAGLEAVVMRCLAKNPISRPATMVAVDEALAALTFDEPWNQQRASAWWTDERNRLRTRARDSA